MTVTARIVCTRQHVFEAADPGPGAYGAFIMYGDDVSAGPAPLDALDNPAFAEVASILRHLPELDALDDNKRAGLLHEIFGVACDPAPNGSRWRIGFPPCPACGTRKVATWSAASR